jgi:hypothetical protein
MEKAQIDPFFDLLWPSHPGVAIDSSFLESFGVVMVIATSSPSSTTQNPHSSFSTMWNASSNVA